MLHAQICLTPIALEVCRHFRAEATVQSSEKIRQSAILPASGEQTAGLETSCIVPAFLQFRLEFGETEIQADLPRNSPVIR